MINHENKSIIIHVPKTAGTSIKNTIGGYDRSVGYHERGSALKTQYSDVWEKYYKFSFVRNPWDRMYSIYSFYRMGKSISLVDSNKVPANFNEFVIGYDKYLNMLGLTYNQIDFIGRYENIENDFITICQKLNISPIPQLKRERTSNRVEDYREVYDSKTKEIVASIFSKDINEFKYSF